MFPQVYFAKQYFPGVYWEPAGAYTPPVTTTVRYYYRGRPRHTAAVMLSERMYYVDEEV